MTFVDTATNKVVINVFTLPLSAWHLVASVEIVISTCVRATPLKFILIYGY